MSSLRLALKQSLEAAGPLIRETESKGKRRGRPKKIMTKIKIKKRRLITDSDKSPLSKEDDNSRTKMDRSAAAPLNRSSKHDSDEEDASSSSSRSYSSGSSSGSSSSSSSVSSSSEDESRDRSASENDEDDNNDDESSDDERHLSKGKDHRAPSSKMMEGVFETEASSDTDGKDEDDDDQDNISSRKKEKQTTSGGSKNNILPTSQSADHTEASSDVPESYPRKHDQEYVTSSHHSEASTSYASSSQVKKEKILTSSTQASLASSFKSQESKKSSHSHTPSQTEKVHKGKKNVPPPTQEVLAWVMGMSEVKQRRNIKVGLRVKVRFTKPQIRWYGGVVTKVAKRSPGGHKIKIKYDDGNKEIANFPDKEIVVDADGNGVHLANADAFLPRDLPVLLSVPGEKVKKKKSDVNVDGNYDTDVDMGELKEDSAFRNVSESNYDMTNNPSIRNEVSEVKSIDGHRICDVNKMVETKKKESPLKDKVYPMPKFDEDSVPRVDKSPHQNQIIINHEVDADADTDEDASMPAPHPRESDVKVTSAESSSAMYGNSTPDSNRIIVIKQSVESKTSFSHNSELTDDYIETEGEDDNMKSVGSKNKNDYETASNLAHQTPKIDSTTNQSENNDDKVSGKIKSILVDNDDIVMAKNEMVVEQRIDRRRKEHRMLADGSNKKKRRKEKEDGRKRKKEMKDESLDNENWVQCERCMKWRCLLTLSSDEIENLPEKWFCEMNPDIKRNFCDATEQTASEVAKERKKIARSLKSTKSLSPTNEFLPSPAFEDIIDKRSGNSDSGDESQQVDGTVPIASQSRRGRRGGRQPTEERGKRGRRATKQKDDENQQEWVQCENCEKWRRLPLAISAKDLPDKWYCAMNTWDPRSASCAVQEDYKKEDDKPKESNILGANAGGIVSAGGSRLSYRNLIRQPTRTISERMRAADSIFSNHAAVPLEEQTGFPVCLYANSSMFQQRMRFGAENHDPEPTVSLFDIMNKTQLWKNLYRTDVSMDLLSSPWNISGKDLISDIKLMVYQILPSDRALAAHDIMLECQCHDLGVKFREVSAMVTFDLITTALGELINEGKVESLSGISETTSPDGPEVPYSSNSDIVLYKKIGTDTIGDTKNLMVDHAPMRISPSNSISNVEDSESGNLTNGSVCRLMKFSKPWKKQKLQFDLIPN